VERPDNIRCEQSLGETKTVGNREYGGVLLFFLTYLRVSYYYYTYLYGGIDLENY